MFTITALCWCSPSWAAFGVFPRHFQSLLLWLLLRTFYVELPSCLSWVQLRPKIVENNGSNRLKSGASAPLMLELAAAAVDRKESATRMVTLWNSEVIIQFSYYGIYSYRVGVDMPVVHSDSIQWNLWAWWVLKQKQPTCRGVSGSQAAVNS